MLQTVDIYEADNASTITSLSLLPFCASSSRDKLRTQRFLALHRSHSIHSSSLKQPHPTAAASPPSSHKANYCIMLVSQTRVAMYLVRGSAAAIPLPRSHPRSNLPPDAGTQHCRRHHHHVHSAALRSISSYPVPTSPASSRSLLHHESQSYLTQQHHHDLHLPLAPPAATSCCRCCFASMRHTQPPTHSSINPPPSPSSSLE